jgi:uncharacterized protein DUF4352
LDGNIGWKRAIGLFVVLPMVLWMPLGCGGQASSAGGTSTPVPTETEAAKITPAPSEYTVGESADIDDETLKVNEVEHDYSPSSGSSSPLPGDEFIRVNVTVSNEGSTPQAYNEFYYKVEDSKGLQRGVSLVPVSEGFTLGTLAPGQTVTGNMVFEVPQGESGLKLIVGNRDVIVKL